MQSSPKLTKEKVVWIRSVALTETEGRKISSMAKQDERTITSMLAKLVRIGMESLKSTGAK